MTEDQIRDLLREMRDEPPPPDSLARVRLAVAEQIRARRPFGTFWKIAAVLAPACLLVVILLTRGGGPAPPEPVRLPIPEPPVRAAQVSPPPPAADVKPVRVRRRVRPAPPKGDNLLIRIETPDPDVVILLVGS